MMMYVCMYIMYYINNSFLFNMSWHKKNYYKSIMLSKSLHVILSSKRFYSGVSEKVRAQKYVLTKYFQGEPKQSDFMVVEEELGDLKDGGE